MAQRSPLETLLLTHPVSVHLERLGHLSEEVVLSYTAVIIYPVVLARETDYPQVRGPQPRNFRIIPAYPLRISSNRITFP